MRFAKTHDSFNEKAFELLTSDKAKRAFDLSHEDETTRDRYGRNRVGQGLLLARRLVESGVRFVTVKGYVRYGWDHHPEVFPRLRTEVPPYDQGYAALLNDLDERGMLDDTVVIFGGEFGRTIYSQGRLTKDNHGRDHHGRCFSTWVAGGGFRPGIDYGKTDDFSYNITENPVHINDLNATILHCLGIDHERFSVKYQGLDVRLTGVEGAKVIPALLA